MFLRFFPDISRSLNSFCGSLMKMFLRFFPDISRMIPGFFRKSVGFSGIEPVRIGKRS
jgi:hypothetical protein